MRKRVFIIHGWGGSPQNCWFPWLKNELEKKGFAVQVLSMPHSENPTITGWVNYLVNAVGEPDKNTFFVGHSIGCQTILRYIEQLQKPIGGVVCVAGFFKLLHLATNEEKEIAKPWLETRMDFKKIKELVNKIVAIFSDDDPLVPISDAKIFESKLGAKIIIEHGKEHFSENSGIEELPSALEAVLEIAGEKQ